MKESINDTAGIQRIIIRYRTHSRVPEKLNFYSRKDLIAAERKFLKFAIMNGGFGSIPPEDFFGSQVPQRHTS